MSAGESPPQARVEIAIAVVERDGRLLIGLRGEDAALGGYWEFPGGKIEERESPEEAARRECLEETGLVVRVTGAYPAIEHDYEHARVRLHFLACAVVDEKERPLPARFRWVTKTELTEYRFPPANRALLALLGAGDRNDDETPSFQAKNR